MTLTITSRPLYAVLLALFLLNVALLTFSRATLDTSTLPLALGSVAVFGSLFWITSRLAQARPGRVLVLYRQIFEGMFFMTLVSVTLPMLNHLTMMLPFPYQDDLLAGWDAALGIDWVAYFELVHSSPLAIRVLEESYVWLALVGMLSMILLIVMGDQRRTRFYIEVFFVTAVICILTGAAFPALAAVDRYIADLSAYPNYTTPPGVYHLPYLGQLRDPAAAVAISPMGLPGLVTFPSYHTASGVLLCVAFWRTWAFVPITLYSGTMIASSPIFGGHYVIDLFAGAALALAVCYLYARKPRYAGLFAARSGRGAGQMA